MSTFGDHLLLEAISSTPQEPSSIVLSYSADGLQPLAIASLSVAEIISLRLKAKTAGYKFLDVNRHDPPYLTTLLCPNLHRITLPFAADMFTRGTICARCDVLTDYYALDLNEPIVMQSNNLISQAPPKVADLTALSVPTTMTSICKWTCPSGHICKSNTRNLRERSRRLKEGSPLCSTCIINTLQSTRNITCLEIDTGALNLRYTLNWKCNLCFKVFRGTLRGTHKC